MNPEIFSVIRYLIKMFQYELKPKKEDLERIKEIINEFSASELKTGYAKFWWEMNVRKLFMQNSDLERTWRVLDELGLKEKLISLGGNKWEKGSLTFWLHKEPLRTKKIREGEGRTAKDLGIEIVSHETSDFEAYEIITRSLEGKPNVFISRENADGEHAFHGEGFYTVKGLTGRAGTGFTIRFHVHPEAREGADFALYGDIVIFRNKAVLRVIPDSSNLSFRGFFEFLKRSEKNWKRERGLLERLRRKINRELLNSKVSDKDIDYVYKEIVLDSIEEKNSSREVILQEWFELDVPLKYLDFSLIKRLFEIRDREIIFIIIENILLKDLVIQEYHQEWMKFMEALIEEGYGLSILRYVLSKDLVIREYHKEWVKFMEVLIEKGYGFYILRYVLSKDLVIREYHKEWVKFMEVLIEKGNENIYYPIVNDILSKVLMIEKYPKKWIELVEISIKKGHGDSMIWTLLLRSVMKKLQEGNLIQTLIEKDILTKSMEEKLATIHSQWRKRLQTAKKIGEDFSCKPLF